MVIGGGAVGVCCAYSLARSGRSVLLLERDALCAGSSWGNSGLLTTSACAPEAAPGCHGPGGPLDARSRWAVPAPPTARPSTRSLALALPAELHGRRCTARDELPPRSRPGEHRARRGARARDAARLRIADQRRPRALHDREGTRRGDRRSRRTRTSGDPIRGARRGRRRASRAAASPTRSSVAFSIPRTPTSIPANTSLRSPTSLGRTARGSRREPRSCGFTAHTASRRSRRRREADSAGDRRSRKRCLGARTRPQRGSEPARRARQGIQPHVRRRVRDLRSARCVWRRRGSWSRRCATTSASRASSTSSD